jgi:hypothetical protein
MGNQTIDYEAVIRDLERRRAESIARFDTAIAALKQVAATQTNGPKLLTPSLPFASAGPSLPYRGMSMVEAAIAHIKSVGRPVPNPELAKAVSDGGFIHNSKNFGNTLNSILWRRFEKVGDVQKTPEGWALAEGKSQD